MAAEGPDRAGHNPAGGKRFRDTQVGIATFALTLESKGGRRECCSGRRALLLSGHSKRM